jgi:CheY-like chemotaxis protein
MIDTWQSILIIDDNDAVRTALEVLLALQGHRVLAASSPDEGLRTLAKEQIDLVLQDMNFRKEATSGEEGVALFHATRERYPTVADRAAHRVDASGNGGRAGEGRRGGLRGEAVGRCAAAHDRAQPSRTAATRARA